MVEKMGLEKVRDALRLHAEGDRGQWETMDRDDLAEYADAIDAHLASQPAEQPSDVCGWCEGKGYMPGDSAAKRCRECKGTGKDRDPQPKAAPDAQVVVKCPKCGASSSDEAATRCIPDSSGDSCPGCEEPIASAWDAHPAPSRAVVDIEDDRVLALRELSYVSGMQLGWQLCEAGNKEEFESIVERRAIPAVGELRRSAQQAAGAVFDFVAHLQRQRDWSCRTFGPGSRAQGVIDHIRKELKEIEADPDDLKEWIDVVILALDGAWRSGAQPQEILDALIAKQTKNEGRVWPDWRTADPNKAIEHDRSHDEQPVATARDAKPGQAVGDGVVDALRPFAAVADIFAEQEYDSYKPWADGRDSGMYDLTLGQFRAARRALASVSTPRPAVATAGVGVTEGKRQWDELPEDVVAEALTKFLGIASPVTNSVAMRRALEVALSMIASPSAPRVGVPEGWKVVPVEPTEEMESAAWNGMEPQAPRMCWKSMLAAAPESGGV